MKAKKAIKITSLSKKRRKSDYCLNCGTTFDESYNYCPNCGQENNHNRASFATLVIDFLNNYFSLDSKFSMSLLPFFLKPGYLTIKFIQGKRASFVNPIRLYLIVSLVFFFVFSMVSSDLLEESISDFERSADALPDSSKAVLDNVLAGDFSELEEDSVYKLTPEKKNVDDPNYAFTIKKPDTTQEFLTEENIAAYMQMRNDYNYTVQEVLDSLDTSSLSNFEYKFTRQLIRLDRAEGQVVISQMLKNLPIMMLFTLPIFALILKLFYLRRNQYYITHLVHALHLHSFAYLIYGLAFLMAMYWLPEGNASTITILASLLIVTVHSYFSYLNVYSQGWFKTLMKFFATGVLYCCVLLIAVLLEFIVSIYTY